MSLTTGGRFLLEMLLVKPKTIEKEKVYDIPSYFFHFWLANLKKESKNMTPIISYADTMFGVFGYQKEIEDLCYKYLMPVDVFGDGSSVMRCPDPIAFRRLVVREVYGIDLTIDDVNDAMKVMVGNKLIDDKGVKELVGVLSMFLPKVEPTEDNKQINQAVEYDHGNKLHMTDVQLNQLNDLELAELELAAWKGLVMAKYQPFCEDMGAVGLVAMKQMFTDFFGEKFEPQSRQRWFLVNLARINIVVSCRRGGKTFFGTYLVARQFYIPNQIIIYVVPTLKNHAGTPRRYLETMFGNDAEVSFDKQGRTIRHRTLKSEIQFLSAERDSNVRSQAANLLIFDEAAFLSENIYETAVPLVRTTKGIVYVISTVNPDTPKNRFYYKLIEAEIQMYDNNSGKVARRVTLHDNPFIDEDEKKNIIADGQRNPKMFGAEWMCEFQESDSFDLKHFWTIDYDPVEKMFAMLWMAKIQRNAAFKESMARYSRFIICYDAAKRKDQPAIAVIGLTQMVSGEKNIGVAEIVVAGYMSNLEYYDQVKVIAEMYDFFGRQKSSIVVEMNNTGIVVEEILRREHRLPVVAVTAVGGTLVKKDVNGRYVGKGAMLGKVKTAMSMKQLKGYSFMNELRMEFEGYDEGDERKDGHHFDLIAAIRTGIRYASRSGWFLDIDGEQQYFDPDGESGISVAIESMPRFGYHSEWGRFQGGAF